MIMSGKKSRNKGAGFERLIANMFAEAYGVSFRRTPLSGGWAAEFADAAGDIVCVEPNKFESKHGFSFHYCIECKKSEGWKFGSLFTESHMWFDNWWKQLEEECPGDKIPLLVFSQNYSPIWLVAKFDTLSGCPGARMTFSCNGEELVVVLLEEFLWG